MDFSNVKEQFKHDETVLKIIGLYEAGVLSREKTESMVLVHLDADLGGLLSQALQNMKVEKETEIQDKLLGVKVDAIKEEAHLNSIASMLKFINAF